MSGQCLYFSPTLEQVGSIDEPRLSATTERHKLSMCRPQMRPTSDPKGELAQEHTGGVVFEMQLGWASRAQLAVASAAIDRSMRVWFYWPAECVVEVVTAERVQSWRRHGWFILAGLRLVLPVQRRWEEAWTTESGGRRPWWAALKGLAKAYVPDQWIRARRNRRIVDALLDRVQPVALVLEHQPTAERPIRGTGVYLRTDFWANIQSGGSYGHTSYVVKELARVTENFICFMAHPFALIESFGIRQVDIGEAGNGASEDAIIEASRHYFPKLRKQLEQIKPAYIYERAALGSYVGAVLSRELQIPYILEYNGSEISMLRSFNHARYIYESVYLLVEELAFRQATFISVVSEEIKKTLIGRGIPPAKILVNPNGADLEAYQPGTPDEKRAIRRELQLPDDACVVAFSGTFGGWHGVDVLAAAIPRICAENPSAAFLLIGDGNFKFQVDEAVTRHGLGNRVISVGRVPQAEGARLLKACDLYVSPHSSNMVDSRFFGSPTKVFEYMAMAGGVVASDLEQIGVVLSPALRVVDLRRPDVTVSDQRSVLCKPGDVEDFVEAVVLLSRRPQLWSQLGRNARRAVADRYSWRQHIEHLWAFARDQREIWGSQNRAGARFRKKWSDLLLHPNPEVAPQPVAASLAESPSGPHAPAVVTGDAYKDEVQRQWDNDPAGSHYVDDVERHSLAWFLEVERYRYRDYAPWMREVMEFDRHAGERVLEIGAGIGTDLAQFAKGGALVTDLDLSSGHLALAKENFTLRGLSGEFVLHDAEELPFETGTFDLVYSNGVLHHTPNTSAAVAEIFRVLKPGGRVIVMVYAETSLHYWRNLVWEIGLKERQVLTRSMGDIMSAVVERSDNAAARPLVKVYTKRRLRDMFAQFSDIDIVRRQMVHSEVPKWLARVPVAMLGRVMGWNLIVKARKPAAR
jgi:glycosyltransferase involved in cell wall biosynthesis/ubiquinone/menaquinone biosynthesis C-methylase UbiE